MLFLNIYFFNVFNLSEQTKGPCLEMVCSFLGTSYITLTLC